MGVAAPGLNPADVTVGMQNLCLSCGLTVADTDGVLTLTTDVVGTDVLGGVNLCGDVATTPDVLGGVNLCGDVATTLDVVDRTPREGIEGRAAPGLGRTELGLVVDITGIRACAAVAATLEVVILTPVAMEATGDAVVLKGREDGDGNLCPD